MFPPIAGIVRLYRSPLNALPDAPRTGSRSPIVPRRRVPDARNL
jgi:hypothetical protein